LHFIKPSFWDKLICISNAIVSREREDTERLVTEIEMLKVVLFLVCRKIGKEDDPQKLHVP
jgi:hypothetical protein